MQIPLSAPIVFVQSLELPSQSTFQPFGQIYKPTNLVIIYRGDKTKQEQRIIKGNNKKLCRQPIALENTSLLQNKQNNTAFKMRFSNYFLFSKFIFIISGKLIISYIIEYKHKSLHKLRELHQVKLQLRLSNASSL